VSTTINDCNPTTKRSVTSARYFGHRRATIYSLYYACIEVRVLVSRTGLSVVADEVAILVKYAECHSAIEKRITLFFKWGTSAVKAIGGTIKSSAPYDAVTR